MTGLLLLVMTIGGCSLLKVRKGTYSPGKVLILPPKDVVQNGVPHTRGVGSGMAFMGYLRTNFGGTSFEALTTANPDFTHTETADKEMALAEARRLKADYCLQLELGEFLDAAPMTFRSDYVNLNSGVRYKTDTGKEVWRLISPRMLQKSNLGGYHQLIQMFARAVVQSIVRVE